MYIIKLSTIAVSYFSMYSKESCEAAGDNLIDLVDYCHRQITYLVSRYVTMVTRNK